MVKELKDYTEMIFENIKYTDEKGNEYWLARELQHILGYTKWRRFESVDHFANVEPEKEIIH